MRPWLRSTLVLLIILLLVTVAFTVLYRPSEPVNIPQARNVYVEMRMSLSGITPSRIEVEQGTVIALNITSLDVKHTFGLPRYGIVMVVPAGGTVNRSIMATIPGQFNYQCMEILPGHSVERGTLLVNATPPTRQEFASGDTLLGDPPGRQPAISPQNRPQ